MRRKKSVTGRLIVPYFLHWIGSLAESERVSSLLSDSLQLVYST